MRGRLEKRVPDGGHESAGIQGLDELYDRRAFEKLLAAEAARMGRYGGTFSLLLFELDRTAEARGHDLQQELLLTVSELLHRNVRGCDYAAYWGGERFAILAPAIDLTEAAGFAVKIRRLIAEHPFRGGISASIGVAEADDEEPPQELLQRCERAMLSAGSSGGNRVAVDRAE